MRTGNKPKKDKQELKHVTDRPPPGWRIPRRSSTIGEGGRAPWRLVQDRGHRGEPPGRIREPRRSRSFGKPWRIREFGEPWRSRQFRKPWWIREFGEPWRSRQFVKPWRIRKFGEPWRSRQFGKPGRIRESGEPWRSRKFVKPWRIRESGEPWRSGQFVRPWRWRSWQLRRPWRIRGLRRPWRILRGLSRLGHHGHRNQCPDRFWGALWRSGHWRALARSGAGQLGELRRRRAGQDQRRRRRPSWSELWGWSRHWSELWGWSRHWSELWVAFWAPKHPIINDKYSRGTCAADGGGLDFGATDGGGHDFGVADGGLEWATSSGGLNFPANSGLERAAAGGLVLDRGWTLSRHRRILPFSWVRWCLGGPWGDGIWPRSRTKSWALRRRAPSTRRAHWTLAQTPPAGDLSGPGRWSAQRSP